LSQKYGNPINAAQVVLNYLDKLYPKNEGKLSELYDTKFLQKIFLE